MQPTALNPIKPLYPNIYWMFASLLIEITILLTHNSESLILSVSSNLFEVFPGNIYRTAHCTIFRKTKTILKSERPTLNRNYLSNLSQKYKIKLVFLQIEKCALSFEQIAQCGNLISQRFGLMIFRALAKYCQRIQCHVR